MTGRRFYSSRPNNHVLPKPYSDPSLRYHAFGRVQPMDEDRPSLLDRIFRRRR